MTGRHLASLLVLAIALGVACESARVEADTPDPNGAAGADQAALEGSASSGPGGAAPPTAESVPEAAASESAAHPSDAAAKTDVDARSKARETHAAVQLHGRTIDGSDFDTASLAGTRYVIFLFDPAEPRAAAAARGVQQVARLATTHNFAIVGVATRAEPDAARAFVAKADFAFPVLVDTDRALATKLGVHRRLAVLGVDAEGQQVYFSGGFPNDPTLAPKAVEAQLREHLRLDRGTAQRPERLGEFPDAPRFTAPRLGGGEPFALDSAYGRPVVLIFFLHSCPYCQMALAFHRGAIASVPEAQRPRFIGVEVSSASDATVAVQIEKLELGDLEVLRDPSWAVQQAYGVFGDVPIIFYLDGSLRVIDRAGPGWDNASDQPLSAMYISKIAGLDVPGYLHGTNYSGNEVCGACHYVQQDAWLETPHARALDTLVDHGRDRDPECVKCHTVGFGEPGGYELPTSHNAPDHLEGVGCEACHGRGGPHLSGSRSAADYEATCKGCHDDVHSLGFDFTRDSARISHRILASLDAQQRSALRARERPLLPVDWSYVGSAACQSCHPDEFTTWQGSRHAAAGATLAQHPDATGDCLRCHTTGYGRTGGFPADARLADHGDLGRVGCEACHGPGSGHIGPEATRKGTIVRLSEKCDSCVILQICGSCHDDQNDPGFAFRVEDMIHAQRHGGIWQRPE